MNNKTNQASEQPAQQEPWGYGRVVWGEKTFLPELPAMRDGSWLPLYTSPPAQRKPLTITEESAWDLARYVYARSNPHESPQILLSAMEIKQIIEAAHNIKENT